MGSPAVCGGERAHSKSRSDMHISNNCVRSYFNELTLGAHAPQGYSS